MSEIEPVQSTVVRAQRALAAQAVSLPPDAASAGQARRLVRHVLAGAGKHQWIESCELAVTEVVSNAVLHAHTASEMTISVADDHVRIEVRDFSPVLPVQRDYTEQATTGRGMALVAALTHEHGLSDVGPGGKTVWFTVRGEPAQQSEEELLEAWTDAKWDLDELLADPPAAGPVTTVSLRALPPTLWLAARQHHDAIIRELVLYQAEHGDITVDIAGTDRARAIISTAVEQAQLAGTAVRPLPDGHRGPLEAVPAPLDLEIDVPEELCSAFPAMQDTLDVAERLARDGKLLARPGLPEIIAVRDWACEQVTAQIAGVPPAPWPGTDQERFTTAVHDRDGEPDLTDWDIPVVRGSNRGVVAADEANRIIAVSGPLAQLVGWDVDDLVGRRVVTIVPPALREAHVAGFTRHLTAGESHVLDIPLTLPVLHRDGSEITCSFVVQQAPTTSGRAVYLAWIEPLEFEG